MLRPVRSEKNTRPLVVLIVLALVLTTWQHKARSGQGSGESRRSLPERVAVAMTWPLQRAFAAVDYGLSHAGGSFGHTRELAARCARLERENEELRAQQLSLVDAQIENQQLKKALGFRGERPAQGLACRVVGLNFGLTRKRLTIAAPPGRELEVNNIVRTASGLVGRVVEARGERGEVFLLVDGEHAVSGRVRRSRDQGMVHLATQSEDQPTLLVMDKIIGRADVREGDEVVTSGLGEVYPPGIPLGVVVRIERSTAGTVDLRALIKPFVDFDRLEWVLVERHGR